MSDLEREVIKLIVCYRDYQRTRKGLYFLEQSIDNVLSILQRNPDLHEAMKYYGLIVNSNGSFKRG